MENKHLIVTVSPTPLVKLISTSVDRVLIGGEMFEDAGAGDTNGFYDFLRLPQGEFIGLRFTPFVEFSSICDLATPGPGLRITGNSPTVSVELFWGARFDYDKTLSVDQFFDCNYIFKSSSKRYAVTFGFLHLPEKEIEGLLSSLAGPLSAGEI